MDGPGTQFIDPVKANFDITFACISYLVRGSDLVAPDISPDEQCSEVCQGVHGLCRYAHNNWVYHLQRYSVVSGGVMTEESKILKDQVMALYEKQHQYLQYYDTRSQLDSSSLPQILVEEDGFDMPFLQDLPAIMKFIKASHAFKMSLKTRRFSDNKGRFVSELGLRTND